MHFWVLLFRLLGPNNLLEIIWVHLARMKLAAGQPDVNLNLLLGPPLHRVGHEQDIALNVLLESSLGVSSNLLLLGIVRPSSDGDLFRQL